MNSVKCKLHVFLIYCSDGLLKCTRVLEVKELINCQIMDDFLIGLIICLSID